ncbi:uncharacterized protein DMENIID0001_171130 [Sergentomyia squamirostris]
MMASSEKNSNHQLILTDLNHDCLLHIFSYLNLKEMTKMRSVSKEFNAVADDAYRYCHVLNYNELSHNPRIKNEKLYEIISKIGFFVNTLLISDYQLHSITSAIHSSQKHQILTLFQACKNLKHLEIRGSLYEPYPDEISQEKSEQELFQRTLINLKTLTMEKTMITTKVSSLFNHSAQLESVSMSICGFFGKANIFRNLRNLKELEVSRDLFIEEPFFDEFCQANQTLEKLKVASSYFFNYDCLISTTKHLKNLQHLEFRRISIERHENVECLKNLPKLTHLTYKNILDADASMLMTLAKQKRLQYLHLSIDYLEQCQQEVLNAVATFQTLKILRLDMYSDLYDDFLELFSSTDTLEELHIPYTKVTDYGVFEFIQRCKHLRYIDLTDCKSITRGLIRKLGGVQLNSPLAVEVTRTRIKHFGESVNLVFKFEV